MYRIPLIKPYIDDEIRQGVLAVLDSGYLTEGPVTKELETLAGSYLGAKHCLAVTSCTTGLELALRALKIGAGDEVIVPAYTYPASALAVSIVGATAVIVDVSPEDMLMDFDELENAVTDKTKAVMPVSLFGNPLDYDRLNEFKARHGVFIVEDAACSIGAGYKGLRVGSIADITVFSLHPRKFITTGEGGLVTTDNDAWADMMHSYKHFGMRAEGGVLYPEFVGDGTNYKLSNIQAAVGVGQMKKIDELLSLRVEKAMRYREILSEIDGVSLPRIVSGGTHGWQSFCVFVKGRDQVMAAMRARGVEVQIGTYNLATQKAFTDSDKYRIVGKCPGSAKSFEECLALPLFSEMTDEIQDEVVETLKDVLVSVQNV
ncbi:MAG: DegT/DnrJ/EryC1/StrS family aminotransferase [Pseudodesulfovibrio sp.]